MTPADLSSLLISCGALQDIAEQTYDTYSAAQLKEVQGKIEEVLGKYLKALQVKKQ